MVTACAVSHNWPCVQKCGVGRVASPVAAPGSDVPSCSYGRTAVGASAPRYQCPSQQRPLQDIPDPVQKEETTPRGNPGPLLVAGANDACGEQPQIRVVWRPNPGVSTSTAGLTISGPNVERVPRWVAPGSRPTSRRVRFRAIVPGRAASNSVMGSGRASLIPRRKAA